MKNVLTPPKPKKAIFVDPCGRRFEYMDESGAYPVTDWCNKHHLCHTCEKREKDREFTVRLVSLLRHYVETHDCDAIAGMDAKILLNEDLPAWIKLEEIPRA